MSEELLRKTEACRLATSGTVFRHVPRRRRPAEDAGRGQGGLPQSISRAGHPRHGLALGEIFFLEEHGATDGRWAFLLVTPLLPVTRAVGTPINPYAIK
jgi:hypothetical protein